MSKSFKIKLGKITTRKPVQKKANSVMKSKKDYNRRKNRGVIRSAISEE